MQLDLRKKKVWTANAIRDTASELRAGYDALDLGVDDMLEAYADLLDSQRTKT